MKSDFLIAVTQLAAERNLPRDAVISAVEAALVSAYKKDNTSTGHNIAVRLNPNTGDVAIYQLKTVVQDISDSNTELTVKEAAKLRKGSDSPQIGDVLEFEMHPQTAGRIAAQTAKQVVIQRLREAERELVYAEFSEREGEVFTATVQRSESRQAGAVTLDLNGRAEATLPPSEQAAYDRYRPGQKMKVLVLEVVRTTRGPEIIVSRAHPDLLRRLFEMEVPEIFNGVVEIKAIAREAGFRSKVSVSANQEGVDPVGACVGLRGIRIQNIVTELQGEKIDVVPWSKDPTVFLSHALSPAQPLRVELDSVDGSANIIVSDRQLSLAIGKEGQNARLAAKLTGWKVDIKSSTELEIERMKQVIDDQVAEQESQKPTDESPVVEELTTSEASAPESTASTEIETQQLEEDATDEQALEPALIEEKIAELTDKDQISIEDKAKISPEEELALESLDLTATTVTDPVVVTDETAEDKSEEETLLIDEDDLWTMPEPSGDAPQIRFAEDILGPSGQRSEGGRKRKNRSRQSRGAPRGPRGT